jgi:DNA-binding beta-propeller fold protein YncE
MRKRRSLLVALVALACAGGGVSEGRQDREKRLLYVASPGIRNLLEWGGAGILVYDIDQGHQLLRRIPVSYMDAKDPDGKAPENVKGICASAKTRRLYVSTITRMACIDLLSEKLLWVKRYPEGCDRMSITPDGKKIYLPTFEKDDWHVVDAESGEVTATISPKSGAHNTVMALDGSKVFLAGLKSPLLRVVDTRTDHILREMPFSAAVRPFTVNGAGTRVYACVNELLGFEVGEVENGRFLHRVEVPGYKKGPVKRHGCPSHGVGLTPDEKELWVVDAFNKAVHVFDNTTLPPKYVQSIGSLIDDPGWVTFTLKGDFAYPSTGDVIDPRTKKIVARLKDEQGRDVQSEKLLEIDWAGDAPIRNGDQFGVGRVP